MGVAERAVNGGYCRGAEGPGGGGAMGMPPMGGGGGMLQPSAAPDQQRKDIVGMFAQGASQPSRPAANPLMQGMPF